MEINWTDFILKAVGYAVISAGSVFATTTEWTPTMWTAIIVAVVVAIARFALEYFSTPSLPMPTSTKATVRCNAADRMKKWL